MYLLNGDCLQTLSTLPASSFDLVVTSPPYNLGIAYKSFKDTAPREEFLLVPPVGGRGEAGDGG